MRKILISKKEVIIITVLSLYMTLITYYLPIQIPCIYKGTECPLRYGFPVLVYQESESALTNPYKNYWALPENFILWFIFLLFFYVIANIIFKSMKKIIDR